MKRSRLKRGTGDCYSVINEGRADMLQEQIARDKDRKKILGA